MTEMNFYLIFFFYHCSSNRLKDYDSRVGNKSGNLFTLFSKNTFLLHGHYSNVTDNYKLCHCLSLK